MKLLIIKTNLLLSFFLLFLFVFVGSAKASAPVVKGLVINTATNLPINNVWVRWTDSHGNVRYAKTQYIEDPELGTVSGYYMFPSWQGLAGNGCNSYEEYGLFSFCFDSFNDRDSIYNTFVDTDFDGTAESRLSSTNNFSGYGCGEDPHQFTMVIPSGWGGSATTVYMSMGNTGGNGNYSVWNPPIYYTPPPSINHGPIGYVYYNTAQRCKMTGWTCDEDYPWYGGLQVDFHNLDKNPTFIAAVWTNYFWSAEASTKCGLESPQNYGFKIDFTTPIVNPIDQGAARLGAYGISVNTSGVRDDNPNKMLICVQDGVEKAPGVPCDVYCPASPKVNAVSIGQGNVPATKGGKYQFSGLQAQDIGGHNWLNPVKIRLDVTNSSSYPNNTQYYVLITTNNVNSGSTFFTNGSSNSSPTQGDAFNAVSNPANGLLLGYFDNNWQAWNPRTNNWNTAANDQPAKIRNESNMLLYDVYPGQSSNEWQVYFEKDLGNKTFNITGFATGNKDNTVSDFKANLAPTPIQ